MSSSRDALFGGAGGGGGYAPLGTHRVVGWDDDDEEDDRVGEFGGAAAAGIVGGRSRDAGSSVQQIRQQQYDLMTEQDRGLEALSEVISRQKNLAHVIGNEVDYQNDLIDDITDHVDQSKDRLIGVRTRVETIDRKDSTGKYWAIIILLLVAIIIITAV